MIYDEETSNKCHAGFQRFYVTLTCELRNVRYANYSPVYHSISSFDHTSEMACSTSDSSLDFLIKDYSLFEDKLPLRAS